MSWVGLSSNQTTASDQAVQRKDRVQGRRGAARGVDMLSPCSVTRRSSSGDVARSETTLSMWFKGRAIPERLMLLSSEITGALSSFFFPPRLTQAR
jgi:hypothetical protein